MGGRQGREQGKLGSWFAGFIWVCVFVGIPTETAFAVYNFYRGRFGEASAYLHWGAAGPGVSLAIILVLEAFGALVAIEAFRSRKWCDMAPCVALLTTMGGGNLNGALAMNELSGPRAEDHPFTFWTKVAMGVFWVGLGVVSYVLLKRGPKESAQGPVTE